MFLEENKNHGVIVVEFGPTDYVAGATSPLEIEIINPSGNNRLYKPSEENQHGKGADKMNCVTVSGSGCIETDLMILWDIKKLPQTHIDWLNKWKFRGADGIIRTSTRFAAIQNGTTMQGNSAVTVGQWFHENGFIPEWMLPNNQDLEWNPYYDKSVITEEMKQCAKESLEYFKVNYEWVKQGDDELKKALQRGAVQILTAVCPGWNNPSAEPIKACNLAVQHATEVLQVIESGGKYIWDSYDPHEKKLTADYPIPWRMLYLVKPLIKNNEDNMIFIKEVGKPDIYLVNKEKKTKIQIVDMPTLEAMDGQFSEVESLAEYTDKGSLNWCERKIN